MTKIFRMKNGVTIAFDWDKVKWRASTDKATIIATEHRMWAFEFDQIDEIEVLFN